MKAQKAAAYAQARQREKEAAFEAAFKSLTRTQKMAQLIAYAEDHCMPQDVLWSDAESEGAFAAAAVARAASDVGRAAAAPNGAAETAAKAQELTEAKEAIGALFKEFQADRWYWALIESLNKLLITGILGFIRPARPPALRLALSRATPCVLLRCLPDLLH